MKEVLFYRKAGDSMSYRKLPWNSGKNNRKFKMTVEEAQAIFLETVEYCCLSHPDRGMYGSVTTAIFAIRIQNVDEYAIKYFEDLIPEAQKAVRVRVNMTVYDDLTGTMRFLEQPPLLPTPEQLYRFAELIINQATQYDLPELIMWADCKLKIRCFRGLAEKA